MEKRVRLLRPLAQLSTADGADESRLGSRHPRRIAASAVAGSTVC